jgi:AcrR family transcriptional regulator
MARRKSDDPDAPRRRILDAAEAVLRRHGPAKLTVSEVARSLGQSHASVYRYYASKADLVDALVGRWLAVVTTPLAVIAGGEGPAAERLRAWMMRLRSEKLRKVTADPEHFAAYHALAGEARAVVDHHVNEMASQVELIVASGVASGEFRVSDPRRAAAAALSASARFHHPALLLGPAPPPSDAEVSAVIELVLAGLRAGVL